MEEEQGFFKGVAVALVASSAFWIVIIVGVFHGGFL